MATLLLTAAAQASGVGGLAGAGLTALAGIGGRLIDTALFAPPGRTVERTGPRLHDVHILSSSEGAPIARLWGRARLDGQLIWATRFKEVKKTTTSTAETGGKGGGGGGGTTTTKTTTFNYFVSIAVAFCEGETAALGRVWADGKLFDLSRATHRFYTGSETQSPDPLIETVEGAGEVPAYRGVSYLVFEELDLGPFGNRIPQISAEVVKPIVAGDLEGAITGVALIPGSGEFVYGSQVHVKADAGEPAFGENMNNPTGEADLLAALDQLQATAPNSANVLLVVAWFGDDLRAGSCTVRPKVEVDEKTVVPAGWRVNGLTRAGAQTVSTDAQGRPVYGGTPSDHVVVQAIQELAARGFRVVFYPFILMDIPAGNGLDDPYGGAEQAAFPWRGRITCDPAPGEPGTVDKTAAAATQIDAFFGTAAAGDFDVDGEVVDWTGAAGEWGYRRMALHYAHLCEAAGGVDGFAIASELVGLTTVRASASAYPAVDQLVTLAGDVAAILAAGTKLTYAADWSEYHSHRPDDGSGDVYFNLDPLWSDPAIDAVGIDNYLPLSDWRDGTGHLDYDPGAGVTSIYGLGYLQANIEGGEYFDWYYATPADRQDQTRTTITDGAGKPWVFRNKDIRSWWENAHYDRPGGTESGSPSDWVAEGKPIWFTEFGCPAVDKGTNQPYAFVDPKSAESTLPHFSRGTRDDLIQRQYLIAETDYWAPAAGNNPTSGAYGGPMVDPASMFAWAWDARPYPDFPFRSEVWSDAGNYALGHWISGRLGQISLAALVRDICLASGLAELDVADLYGTGRIVNGFVVDRIMSARAMLEPLMQAYQFDAFESGGLLRFALRGRAPIAALGPDDLVLGDDGKVGFSITRAQETELPRAVKVTFLDQEAEYRTATAEGRKPAGGTLDVEEVHLPVVLDQAYARGLADVILQARWSGRERASAALAPSKLALDPGDAVTLEAGGRVRTLQITELQTSLARTADLVTRPGVAFDAERLGDRASRLGDVVVFGPTTLAFLDIPLLPGREAPAHAPLIAAHQLPWPGEVAVFRARPGGGYGLITSVSDPALIGELTQPLASGPVWRWDRANAVELTLYDGALASADEDAVLGGANALAVENADGDWEILQFADAELTAERQYRLTGLLRGQAGSELEMRDPVAAGARVVVLDPAALVALDLSLDQRLVEADYRYGPAVHDHDHFTYTQVTLAFAGIGLRPLAPVHLSAARDQGSGDVTFTWIRRTRIGGDQWDNADVPLAEEREAYEVDVIDGADVVRTIDSPTQAATYGAAAQTADFGGLQSGYTIRVHQLSAIFGRGAPAEATLDV